MRGEKPQWREWLHIEHAPNHHALTDGREKYLWAPDSGREQFLDLTKDPSDCRDLARNPVFRGRVALWRDRMIKALETRPEGFVRDGELVAGRPYDLVIPGTNESNESAA
jgi:arylsulfatase